MLYSNIYFSVNSKYYKLFYDIIEQIKSYDTSSLDAIQNYCQILFIFSVTCSFAIHPRCTTIGFCLAGVCLRAESDNPRRQSRVYAAGKRGKKTEGKGVDDAPAGRRAAGGRRRQRPAEYGKKGDADSVRKDYTVMDVATKEPGASAVGMTPRMDMSA